MGNYYTAEIVGDGNEATIEIASGIENPTKNIYEGVVGKMAEYSKNHTSPITVILRGEKWGDVSVFEFYNGQYRTVEPIIKFDYSHISKESWEKVGDESWQISPLVHLW